jgi:hypothetical protein
MPAYISHVNQEMPVGRASVPASIRIWCAVRTLH